MIGHLIWEISSKGLEVNRPFTFSTLLMICNQVPTSEDLTKGVDHQLRLSLEKDFRLCFPSKWNILQQLRQSFAHATMLVSKLAYEDINEELDWTFMNFTLDEEHWTKQIEKKLGGIIWSHLFKGRELVGKSLREGFHLAIEAAPVSDLVKESFKNDISLLTPDCLKIAFTGSCSIDAEKFMASIDFESTINTTHREWFKRAIHEMSNAERMRLTIFITGQEFFTGCRILVGKLDRADNPCLQASVCFNQLYLPPYSSYKIMIRMMRYSTMDTSYGRP